MISNITLTTKEKLLLQDQKKHEEQCIIKYANYENLAVDPQLKAVFRTNGQKEKEHLDTINQLLSGKVPSMNSGQAGGNQQQSGQSGQGGMSSMSTSSGMQASQQSSQQNMTVQQTGSKAFQVSDKDLCTDMLMTEKYVSGTYDTTIFEFRDASVRDVLNHIQKEEQKHGEAIFKYMESKGMYQAQ